MKNKRVQFQMDGVLGIDIANSMNYARVQSVYAKMF